MELGCIAGKGTHGCPCFIPSKFANASIVQNTVFAPRLTSQNSLDGPTRLGWYGDSRQAFTVVYGDAR